MKASLTSDGRVRLQGKSWTGEFPVDQLDLKLAFYRGLQARKSGRYAAAYDGTVRALEAVLREVRAT